jgi:hypothetical protein
MINPHPAPHHMLVDVDHIAPSPPLGLSALSYRNPLPDRLARHRPRPTAAAADPGARRVGNDDPAQF